MKKIILLWLLAGFIGLILIGIWADKQESASQRLPQEVMLPRALFCGHGRSDADDIVRAISVRDTAAITGLIGRGRALALDKGTMVRAYEPIDGLIYVRVRSGANIGETCWVPEGWLR